MRAPAMKQLARARGAFQAKPVSLRQEFRALQAEVYRQRKWNPNPTTSLGNQIQSHPCSTGYAKTCEIPGFEVADPETGVRQLPQPAPKG